jgi:hypothetical protein
MSKIKFQVSSQEDQDKAMKAFNLLASQLAAAKEELITQKKKYEQTCKDCSKRIVIDDMAEELTLLRAVVAWIPIEDRLPELSLSNWGTPILIKWVNELGKSRVSAGFYAHQFECECNCEDECNCDYNEKNGNYFLPVGFYESPHEVEAIAGLIRVTHWRLTNPDQFKEGE